MQVRSHASSALSTRWLHEEDAVSRNTLNIVLDLLSALNLLGMAMTGLILRFVLLPGSGPRSLWTLRRHNWGGVHFWLAVSLCALLLVHVALHWQWVCSTLRRFIVRRSPEHAECNRWARDLVGIVLLIVLAAGLAGFVWLARLDVQQAPRGPGAVVRQRPDAATMEPDRDNRAREPKAISIRGSTTLSQAAASSGASLELLCERLGLPPEVNPDERLDRLGRKYGFSMSQARRIVDELNR
jgi:hypothetical protein